MKRARKIQYNAEPQVVGAVHTLAGLRLAQKLKRGSLDVVEIRVDALSEHLLEVERALRKIEIPLLITVRHPAEGGIGGLSVSRRRELIKRFFPFGAFVDIELRSAEDFAAEIEEIRTWGTKVVISDHYFQSTPTLAQMIARERRAFRAGADIFKLACLAPGAKELARLVEFAGRPVRKARAVMGMGKFGQVSRLALAQAGSVLNYGYLDRPNAPGQWEARELKTLVDRLTEAQ